MPSIRKVSTASGATAVQVIRYENRKVVVLAHVGSAHDEEELASLLETAERILERYTSQLSLFPKKQTRVLPLAHARYLGVTYRFAREFLHACAAACGLHALGDPLLIDLALMRIIEPTSKLRALELLKRYFSVAYGKSATYAKLRTFAQKKEEIEHIAFSCATNVLKDDFALVLYDVTTLYFETFKADDLRIQGFSKDNKHAQPQVVIGLLVTASGFPVAWEVFKGNTFEGHTILPILRHFAATNNVPLPIVVADAAMLSKANTEELRRERISYIVGARLANTTPSFICEVSDALDRMDEKTLRRTYRGESIVCSFSAKRYRKDKHEMEKQIARAEGLIARHESGKRAKFVKKTAAHGVVFDEKLRKKTGLLLGIKGYVTNIPEEKLSNADIISFYQQLWRVEQSFRISKHDLEARPIFHRKDDAVRAHILICFVALMMGKYLEIMTDLPLRRIRDLLWSVTEAMIKNTKSGEVHVMRSSLDEIDNSPLKTLVRKWMSY